MKLIIEHNINLDPRLTKLLSRIFNQNKNIMGALEDIKAKLELSNSKIDILVPAVEGVTKDIASLKKKIEEQASAGNINATGVAELNTILDAQNAKFTEAVDKLVALDAETEDEA